MEEHQDFVLVPKEEFEGMVDDVRFLHFLEQAGVCQWEGYVRALEMYSADNGFEVNSLYQEEIIEIDFTKPDKSDEDVFFDEDEFELEDEDEKDNG